MSLLSLVPGGKLTLYAVAAAACVAGYAYWAHVQQERGAAEVEAVHAKEAFKAGERELAKQQVLVTAKAQVEKKYAEAKKLAAVAVAERVAAEQRLRDELARGGQASGDPSTCRGIDGDPRDCIIAQGSAALGRMDDAVKKLAAQTVGLQNYTREVCLRANN
jgi:hypothetical protein